jgi:cytidylate kinase
MAVITISRQIGAGGLTLGRRLAKGLRYRYVDEFMIREVADKIGVSPEDVRAFEKEGSTKLMKFLDKLVSKDFINRVTSDRYKTVDEKKYLGVVTAIIRELYEQGDVVIVGRGGQYILKDLDNVWRILLVADWDTRIKTVMDSFRLSGPDAEKYIREKDRTRTNFLSLFAERERHDDPRSYDLVINMERLSMMKAEEMIINLISQ